MKFSEKMKKTIKYELTFEPKSLWNFTKNKFLENVCDTGYGKDTSKDYIFSGKGTFLSGWNKEFHKRLIEFYTIEGDTILDPFAGHSSSFIPYLMNRNFIGFEITKERYDIQNEHISKLKNIFHRDCNINLINDSSENIKNYLKENTINCIITDPPFWDLEKYERPVNGEQLSDIKEYNTFLDKLSKILIESSSYLKDNGFLLLKIGDFRRKTQFINLSGDIINKILSNTNLTLIDKIVLELNPNKRPPLYPLAITKKQMLKVQEFVLVFRKINKNTIDEDNDRINWNRKLVNDVYNGIDELFYAQSKGKKDYITEGLEEEYNKKIGSK